MNVFLRATLFASCLLIGFGCGGGGMGGSDTFSAEGNWAGTWDSRTAGAGGTIDLSIAADGSLSGTMHENGTHRDAMMSGRMSRGMAMDASARFSDGQTCSFTGVMMHDQQGHTSGCHQPGHMTGNLMLHMGSGEYETTVDLARR